MTTVVFSFEGMNYAVLTVVFAIMCLSGRSVVDRSQQSVLSGNLLS